MHCRACGENLLFNGLGVVICWFCQERHEVASVDDALPFVSQEVRQVIKSSSDPYSEKQNLGHLP